MLKNRFYLYVLLAWSHGVLAVQTPGTESQIDLAYDTKTFRDEAGMQQMVTEEPSCVRMNGISGRRRDNNVMQTSVMQSFDKEMNQSKGECNKYGVSDKPRQGAPKLISFYATISGQLAATNLDVFEQMGQGGKSAMPAYPEGEAYAGHGHVLNLEARMQLPQLFERQQIESQLIGFVDTAAMTENRNTWVDSLNPNALTGAGIGFNFAYINSFEAKIYVARKIGNDVAVSARDASSRILLQALKYF